MRWFPKCFEVNAPSKMPLVRIDRSTGYVGFPVRIICSIAFNKYAKCGYLGSGRSSARVTNDFELPSLQAADMPVAILKGLSKGIKGPSSFC